MEIALTIYISVKKAARTELIHFLLYIILQYWQLLYLYTFRVLTNQLGNVVCRSKRVQFNVIYIYIFNIVHSL